MGARQGRVPARGAPVVSDPPLRLCQQPVHDGGAAAGDRLTVSNPDDLHVPQVRELAERLMARLEIERQPGPAGPQARIGRVSPGRCKFI